MTAVQQLGGTRQLQQGLGLGFGRTQPYRAAVQLFSCGVSPGCTPGGNTPRRSGLRFHSVCHLRECAGEGKGASIGSEADPAVAGHCTVSIDKHHPSLCDLQTGYAYVGPAAHTAMGSPISGVDCFLCLWIAKDVMMCNAECLHVAVGNMPCCGVKGTAKQCMR